MGNASSSGSRDRHKSGDSVHGGAISPGVKDGQAFTFEKQSPAHRILQLQPSHEEDSEPYYTKAGPRDPQDVDTPEEYRGGRARASTLSEGTKYGTPNQPPQSKILPTVFKWDGGGDSVFISGTFSDWKTIPMVKSHGDLTGTYVAIVDLPEGDHQYKFFIDGQWKLNPSEPMAQSDIGSKNNIISVKKTDFEVFDALDMDSITSTSAKANKYGQDVPNYKPWEKTTGPPILPPHLLQVILNKDTPLSCEPTLLPEPNHVMLNHLYALSIKDGVMVLSATHRYRKKYVTTLLYKPI